MERDHALDRSLVGHDVERLDVTAFVMCYGDDPSDLDKIVIRARDRIFEIKLKYPVSFFGYDGGNTIA